MNGESLACPAPADARHEPVERLASLFDVHYGRLYRLARRMAASVDDALDLVQETFLRAARKHESTLHKTIPADSAGEEAWLVRVLINIQRDQWRRASVRVRRVQSAEAFAPPCCMGKTEQALIARTVIWQALDMLAPRRRAILVMHELEGLDTSAIASLLGINGATVRWHLSRAKHDLAKVFQTPTGENNEKRR